MCDCERVKVDLAIVSESVCGGVWLTIVASLKVDCSSVSCSVGDTDVLVKDTVVVDFQVATGKYNLESILSANLRSLVDVVGGVRITILSKDVEVKTFGAWEEGFNERTIGVIENLENSCKSGNWSQVSDSLR